MPPPHPRAKPRIECPLTADGIAAVFDGCADFGRRTLYLNNDPTRRVEMLYIVGQVRNERASDYVLRPLTQNEALRAAATMDEVFDLMAKGGLYTFAVEVRTTSDQVVFDLINGWVALFFPEKEQVLTFMTATEEKRSVSNPEMSLDRTRSCIVISCDKEINPHSGINMPTSLIIHIMWCKMHPGTAPILDSRIKLHLSTHIEKNPMSHLELRSEIC